MQRNGCENPRDAQHAYAEHRYDHRLERFARTADRAGKYFDRNVGDKKERQKMQQRFSLLDYRLVVRKKQKEILYELMDKVGVKTIVTDNLLITKVNPTTSEKIDSKKLKEELPEIAKKYTKISDVKGYVKITVRADKTVIAEVKEEITNKNIDNKKSAALAALGL